jgi:hypothetical protein
MMAAIFGSHFVKTIRKPDHLATGQKLNPKTDHGSVFRW